MQGSRYRYHVFLSHNAAEVRLPSIDRAIDIESTNPAPMAGSDSNIYRSLRFQLGGPISVGSGAYVLRATDYQLDADIDRGGSSAA